MADEKIFLIYADYLPTPVMPCYAVRKRTKAEAKKYFQKEYPRLKIFGIEEYTDDLSYIRWFW